MNNAIDCVRGVGMNNAIGKFVHIKFQIPFAKITKARNWAVYGELI
jgi:hypothetical protein